MGVWFATREDVMRALDSKETARNAKQIDRALESASRSIEESCHRTFAPVVATKSFSYPGPQYARPWRLWLDANDIVSVTTLTSGSVTINASDYFLEPNQYGPPFTHLEIDLGSSASFSSGSTHQRAITITGLWGYSNDETAVGVLTASVGTTSATTVSVNAAASAELGVGSVLRIDSERFFVTGRAMSDTGQNLGADIDQQLKTVTIPVADGAQFAVDETILIDSERMLIVDVAGNNLTVKRAWDGSPNAAHSSGSDIYAPRNLTVQRGALGTTAATHLDAAAVNRWDPPGLIRDLAIAEAESRLSNEQAAYAKTRRTGDGGTSERAMDATALPSLRQQVYTAHGRKGRVRAV
jgi:hypothetical protein